LEKTYILYFIVILVGLGKAGLKGIDMLSVTLFATFFGSKMSTGILLPLLCVGDIAAVIYYKRHVEWNHFWKLIPPMIGGILIGVWIGKDLDEHIFKRLMGLIVLSSIIIILYMELRKTKTVPTHSLFSIGVGGAAGFATMIGNLAGAFASLYFLAMRSTKNNFIGTAAWIFLCINLFKLPFQVFYWHNITSETLSMDLRALPALTIGFGAGIYIVGKIDEKKFRTLVITLTTIACLIMLFKS
jgi:uncharacterized membrane protein YfcA